MLFFNKLTLAATLAFAPLVAQAAESLKPNDFVAIIGDSITEQKDYSVNIENYLLATQPAAGLTTMQFGWGGETAEGFKNRMANDAFRYHPTVATTCYGMNDGGYAPLSPDRAKSYRTNTKAIVEGMKKAGVRLIVVGSPGCVDANTFRKDPKAAAMYNKTLSEERDLAKAVADEENVPFANVFDPMIDVMTKAKAKFGPDYHLAGTDGVHPGRNGHLVMAYAFLKALGCDGNIGTITVDAATNTATATDGHKVLSASPGKIELESTKYPFCFTGGKPGDPNNQRDILEFLPFNQDLNRLTLIVKSATGKTKVTWGASSKEYDPADLAKGVNLAADFLDNPFVPAFNNLSKAVQKQQNFETPMIKTWVHGYAQLKADMPEALESYETLLTQMATKDKANMTAAIGTLVPVKHTLLLEPVK